jgi:hypothetical protein
MGQWEINGEQFDKSMDWVYAEIARLRAIEEAKNEKSNSPIDHKIINAVDSKEAREMLGLVAAGAKESVDFTSLSKAAFADLEKNADDIKAVLGDAEWDIFKTKLEEGQNAWIDVWNTIPETWRNGLTNIDELTLTQVQGLATQFNDLYEATGDAGVEALQNIINSAGDKSAEFLDKILSEELDSGNIKDQISDIADSLNIDVDEEALKEYAYALEIAYGAAERALELMHEYNKNVV